LLEIGQGAIYHSPPPIEVAAIDIRLGQIGLELDCPVVIGQRLIEGALRGQALTASVKGIRIAGPEINGARIVSDGMVVLAQPGIGRRPAGIEIGVVGLERERFVLLGERPVIRALRDVGAATGLIAGGNAAWGRPGGRRRGDRGWGPGR
jgi:hypothetical protein